MDNQNRKSSLSRAPKPNPENNFKVMQWNSRSIRKNESDLIEHLAKTKPDILAIQSPYCSKWDLPFLEGYYYPPVTDMKGDPSKAFVATYIRQGRVYTAIASPAPNLDENGSSCAIEVQNKIGKKISICNVYYPKGCKNDTTKWLTTLDQTKQWYILGDFNAHHSLWNSRIKTDKDHQLADDITESPLSLLNDGSMTRIPDNPDHCESAIDLSLSSPGLAISTTWQPSDNCLGSDHLPLMITLHGSSPQLVEQDPTPKYNVNKANWPMYKADLEQYSKTDLASPDIEIYHSKIREAILQAADLSMPSKRCSSFKEPPGNAWWNDECNKSKQKVKATTKSVKHPGQTKKQKKTRILKLKQVTACHKHNITKAKQDHFDSYVRENVREAQDAGKIWRKVARLRHRYRLPESPLSNGVILTKTDEEKANLLAETFAKASQTAHLGQKQRDYRAEQEQHHQRPVEDNSKPINLKFKQKELKKAIKGIKSTSKSTGKDPISYKMIQQLPNSFLEILLDFFELCWESGNMPEAWKEAQVIAIHKPGKPKKDPTSYRPISLTPHLGKVYERIIKMRLESFLEKHNIIPVCQAGFRKGRSCTDHIVKLTAHMRKAISSNRTLLATFFDVKRAFDTVWHSKLLDKLGKIGVSGRMYNFIASYLSNRSLQVKIGQSLSQKHFLDMGVPQGSVIAPTLFSIMLHDISTLELKGAILSQFADDIALWETNQPKFTNHPKNLERYQEKVNLLVSYMEENGFALSPEKTVFMVVSRKLDHKANSTIKISGVEKKPSTKVKFLGVTISNNLTWEAHINNLIKKAKRTKNLIKILLGQPWASSSKTLLHICKALVRSRLTYGQEAFYTAAPTLLKKLAQTELSILRTVLKLTNSAPAELVYQEARWLPLDKERKLRVSQYTIRAFEVENTVQEELSLSFDNEHSKPLNNLKRKTPTLWRQTIPIADFTKPVFEATGVVPENVSKIPTNLQPSWTMKEPNIVLSLETDCTKKDDPLYMRTLANEKIERDYNSHLKIFTDGSVHSNGKVGCAFTVPEYQLTGKHRLNEGTSIFTAELFAILQACLFIAELQQPPKSAVILTDSKSALQALLSGSKNRQDMQADIRSLCHEIITNGIDLHLMWIPSHVGIDGNEKADTAAGEAASLPAVTDDLGLSRSEMSTIIKKHISIKWQAELQTKCEQKNWLLQPADPAGQFLHPPLPPNLLKILRRIRTNSCIYKIYPQLCECGTPVSFSHIFKTCPHLDIELAAVTSYAAKHNLKPNDFLLYHSALQWEPSKILCSSIYHSNIGHLF